MKENHGSSLDEFEALQSVIGAYGDVIGNRVVEYWNPQPRSLTSTSLRGPL